MGTWKFLVQREGKQSWTALEGDVMSLEPGRYRIAARAPVANTPIAIEISVMQPDGERRHYRRSTRTNDDGLLAVIPFTDLSDGHWTLNCQSVGNPGVAEAASMAWQVMEPTRIEVADPWAESDGEDGLSCADRVEEDAADGAIESSVDRPVVEQSDVDGSVEFVGSIKSVESVESVESIEFTEPAEPTEPTKSADHTVDGETIEANYNPDEMESLEGQAAANLMEESGTGAMGAIEVTLPIESSSGELLKADILTIAQENQATDPSDVTQTSPNPQDASEGADLPPDLPALEGVLIDDGMSNASATDLAAIGDPDGVEIEESSPTDPESHPIDATAENSETSTIAAADSPGEPSIAPDELPDTIDEPPLTNVIAMPGMAAHLPAAWMDTAASEGEDAETAHPEAVAEILDGADLIEGVEPIDATDRTPSPPSQQGESSEADTPIVGVSREVLNAANPPIEGEPLPDATVPDIVADPEPPTLTTYTPGQLKLQLDRTSFTVAAGSTLTLSGCIQADTSIDPRSHLAGLHLRLRLREPQSSRVLTVRQFLLPPTTGKILHFERSVPLPERTTSKLILGELLLCDTVPTTLDQQSFTVTAGLESLLNNLTDRNRASESVVWQKDQWSDARTQADLPPKTTPPLIPLPPKPTLDLPGFVTNPVSGIDKSQLLASLGLAPATPPSDHLTTESGTVSDPDLGNLSATDLDASRTAPIGDDIASRDAEAAAALEASRRAATRSNRFPLEPLTPPSHRNDRFVSRLNQIAQDNELTSWLNEGDLDLGAEGLPEDFASGDLAPLSGAREVLSPGAIERDREMSQEIVLDRPAEPTHRPSFSRSSPQTSVTRPVLPAEISIPSPELIVPPGHLTAGRSILVRARMPELSARIYIKLWIYDRQNQALLDGPRWLTDFLPLGDGMVEGMVNLTVPYGGLDVQFEAIAVEVETDRESYKTAIERRIVPSPPPTLPLENSSLRP